MCLSTCACMWTKLDPLKLQASNDSSVPQFTIITAFHEANLPKMSSKIVCAGLLVSSLVNVGNWACLTLALLACVSAAFFLRTAYHEYQSDKVDNAGLDSTSTEMKVTPWSFIICTSSCNSPFHSCPRT